jgi:hypothetical protein
MRTFTRCSSWSTCSAVCSSHWETSSIMCRACRISGRLAGRRSYPKYLAPFHSSRQHTSSLSFKYVVYQCKNEKLGSPRENYIHFYGGLLYTVMLTLAIIFAIWRRKTTSAKSYCIQFIIPVKRSRGGSLRTLWSC